MKLNSVSWCFQIVFSYLFHQTWTKSSTQTQRFKPPNWPTADPAPASPGCLSWKPRQLSTRSSQNTIQKSPFWANKTEKKTWKNYNPFFAKLDMLNMVVFFILLYLSFCPGTVPRRRSAWDRRAHHCILGPLHRVFGGVMPNQKIPKGQNMFIKATISKTTWDGTFCVLNGKPKNARILGLGTSILETQKTGENVLWTSRLCPWDGNR